MHESAGWRVRGRPAARPLGIAAPLPTVTARPVAGRGGRVLPGRPPPANATPPSGERAGDVAEVLPHGHLSLAPRRGRPLVRVAAFTVRDFSREINAQYGQVTLSVDLGVGSGVVRHLRRRGVGSAGTAAGRIREARGAAGGAAGQGGFARPRPSSPAGGEAWERGRGRGRGARRGRREVGRKRVTDPRGRGRSGGRLGVEVVLQDV
ncbi:hypothetical protein TBS_15570 [Thermobispora bispora]